MSFNLEDFGGKTILILGGGTSTLDRKWENLDYDYLWTCNSFYMEERLLNKKVDLFMLGYLTDTNVEILVDDDLTEEHLNRMILTVDTTEKEIADMSIEESLKFIEEADIPQIKIEAGCELVDDSMVSEVEISLFESP